MRQPQPANGEASGDSSLCSSGKHGRFRTRLTSDLEAGWRQIIDRVVIEHKAELRRSIGRMTPTMIAGAVPKVSPRRAADHGAEPAHSGGTEPTAPSIFVFDADQTEMAFVPQNMSAPPIFGPARG